MTRRRAAGTIVAHNYVAQARVLARSFTDHNPDAQFFTLVVDGDEGDRALEGVGAVVLPEDLPIDPDELDAMRAMYTVMEYSTALKPAFLLGMYHRNARSAMYLDPDIRVYGPLDDVFEAAEGSGIALTPHTLQPIPRDGMNLTEANIAHSGIYNLGFIATGPSAVRFLAWWHERLKTDAVVDLTNALFTDQRWVDWAPAIEAPAILRDPGLNAAYWNLHEREIRRDEHGVWWAGRAPLRFFHFSGYDPEKPWVFSKHMGERPRILLSEHPGLAELCRSYGAELVESGHTRLRRERYRNDTAPDGLALTQTARTLYRQAYLSAGRGGERPPNPFANPGEFRAWLAEPGRGVARATLNRFEQALWEGRPDLRAAFPDPWWQNAQAFRDWLRGDAGAAAEVEKVGLAPVGSRPAREAVEQRWGWSVAGYARAELGVGEAGRRLALGVAATGLPWEMVGVSDGPLSRQQHAYRGVLRTAPGYENTILCVNADQTPHASHLLGLDGGAGTRVGYWFWELEEFPDVFVPAFDLLDEVWVATEFTRAAVQAKTDKPVRRVPLPVPIPRRPTGLTRRTFGLPEDKTVFLTVFDFLSIPERKNPFGVIAAYTAAFGPADGAILLVKSINGHLRPLERERVRQAIAGRPDIVVLEDYLTSFEVRSLIELSDVLVSLHRSEGYGLNLADAMAVGTPVVATAYSGNMDFMTADVARLVGYELCEVGPGCAPYPATARWADPDLDQASAALRDLFDRPDAAADLAARAREHIAGFSARAVADVLTPLMARPMALAGDSKGEMR